MSDCSPKAWAVPKDCAPMAGERDELVLDAFVPPALLASVTTVRIRQLPDEVFQRRGTCVLTVEYEGYPCSDYRCSSCGKLHNAPRPGAYCPRCGAIVREVRLEGGWEGVDWHEPEHRAEYEESYEWMNDE